MSGSIDSGMAKLPSIFTLLLAVGACQAVPPPISMACPVVGSSDWKAWVNAMPGPNMQSKLIATGKVTLPTGGYTFRWGAPRVMESYPVQVSVELIPIPPAGPATQALATHDVRGEWPMQPPVGALNVTCGDMVLGRISPVETAR